MDRLKTRTDALGRQETYGYDLSGNLNVFTDRKNQQSTFTYDALNRRIGAGFGDGSSVSFTYDSVGRLSSALDSVVGRIDFVYDTLDRLIQEITAQGSIAYAYDALGRRMTMTANGQQPVSYGYDAASRLVQVQQGALVVGIGYDAASRRTSLTYPNGTNTGYSYDFASRLTNIAHNGPGGVIESLTYTYDAAGNRINLARANSAATNLPAAVQAAYDAANEQIQFSTATLTYDANGNLTNDGTNTYTFDARNRLTAISGGVSASFSYDALGRRISKTANGGTTSYLYDGKNIVQESGASGIANYLRSLTIDEPFVRQSSSNEFYHADALGTVLSLTGQTGAVQTSYNYEAFGKTTIGGASSNLFQYTGRENDGTGLYYYRARYYSPTLNRFIQGDPLGQAGGLNLYEYVQGNPLNFVDPLGLTTEVVVWQPVGFGASAYGHVSVTINDTVYSFDSDGMHIFPLPAYSAINNYRDGVGSVLDFTPDQEKALTKCLQAPQGRYNLLTNNCGSPIQGCLKVLGFNLPPTTAPIGLGYALMGSGLVTQFNFYPAVHK